MDNSSSLPVLPPPSSPRDDEATAQLLFILLLVVIIIIGCVVAALCLRVKQTWHNNKERRRLTKRVAWLRDLLQLVPPSSAPAPASSEEEKVKSRAGSTTAAQQAATIRTVLARRIEATMSEVDRLVASASMSMSYRGCCCFLGFARSYALARRLERANKDVDEVYTHLLPVVTQMDAMHRVEQVLVGVMQQQLRDKNNHSDAQRLARPNGSNEFDWKPLLSENNDDQASIDIFFATGTSPVRHQ